MGAKKASRKKMKLANKCSSITNYRHKIGEEFAQRQPSDLASSKPTYFNIDDQVARTLADSKFAAKRQEYSITVAKAFFEQLLTRRRRTLLKRLKSATSRQPTSS